MSISKEKYAVLNGVDVFKYTITNKNSSKVSLISYGATITNIFVKDKNDRFDDILVGFDDLDGFLNRCDYQGMTVGPYANRIGNASFTIDGEEFNLVKNENNSTMLHSNGELNNRIWNVDIVDDNTVKMSVERTDLINGYPGNMSFSVTFTFTDDDELKINYHATTDRKTYINLTNHAYFNLAGFDSGDILNHFLTINSSTITPVDSLSIPTGELMNIENTPFDFRKPKKIGERIDDDNEQLQCTGGYDHNYCVDNYDGTLKHIASVYEENSGRKMDVFTTLPGVQFYAGNFLKGLIGKSSLPINKRTGFCLETQYYPDTPNQKSFPSCMFDENHSYNSETIYKFSLK